MHMCCPYGYLAKCVFTQRGLTPSVTCTADLEQFRNPKEGYRIDRPTSWEQTSEGLCNLRLCCMHGSLRLHVVLPWGLLRSDDVLFSLLAGKAGADVLFVDPARKSSTLGVTVSPVRVDSLDAFGNLDSIAARLLQAERAKVI